MTKVCVLTRTDAVAASALLTRGFESDPAKMALVPEPRARRAINEVTARVRLHDALRYGTVHAVLIDGAPAAVTVWMPPGVPTLSVGAAMRAASLAFPNLPTLARAIPRMIAVAATDITGGIALARKARRAVVRASRGTTWNLALLATHPEHRGRGLARALLERQLSRCDEDGTAAWLETGNPANPAIYERFGFETVAHLIDADWLPGFWVMRRDASRGA